MGLLAHWADGSDDGPRPINVRSETVDEKPMFREAFAERRSLVLADGFYEWQGERGSKQPYRVHLKADEAFAMAGIWNRRENGDVLETVTILTTAPNELMEPIHDRVPVVLAPDEEDDWLEAEPADAEAQCDPNDAEDTEANAVSGAVNNPGNDTPDVVVPADTEQSGIGEF